MIRLELDPESGAVVAELLAGAPMPEPCELVELLLARADAEEHALVPHRSAIARWRRLADAIGDALDTALPAPAVVIPGPVPCTARERRWRLAQAILAGHAVLVDA